MARSKLGKPEEALQAYRKATRIIRNSLRTIAPDGLYENGLQRARVLPAI